MVFRWLKNTPVSRIITFWVAETGRVLALSDTPTSLAYDFFRSLTPPQLPREVEEGKWQSLTEDWSQAKRASSEA